MDDIGYAIEFAMRENGSAIWQIALRLALVHPGSGTPMSIRHTSSMRCP